MSNYKYSYFDINTHKGIGEIELYERYDEILDDRYGMTKIAGVAYDTSNAQKKVDPVAYEQGYYGWVDGELNETILDKDGLKDAIIEQLQEEDLDTYGKVELYDEIMDLYFPCNTFEEMDKTIEELKSKIGSVNHRFVNGMSKCDHDEFFEYLEGEYRSYGDAYQEAYNELKNEKWEDVVHHEGHVSQEAGKQIEKELDEWSAEEQSNQLSGMAEMYENNMRDELIESIEANNKPTQERWSKAPSHQEPEEDDTTEAKKTARFKR